MASPFCLKRNPVNSTSGERGFHMLPIPELGDAHYNPLHVVNVKLDLAHISSSYIRKANPFKRAWAFLFGRERPLDERIQVWWINHPYAWVTLTYSSGSQERIWFHPREVNNDIDANNARATACRDRILNEIKSFLAQYRVDMIRS